MDLTLQHKFHPKALRSTCVSKGILWFGMSPGVDFTRSALLSYAADLTKIGFLPKAAILSGRSVLMCNLTPGTTYSLQAVVSWEMIVMSFEYKEAPNSEPTAVSKKQSQRRQWQLLLQMRKGAGTALPANKSFQP